MLGWFKSNDRVYAERLYEALAVPELGNMTPHLLGIPRPHYKWYQEKALLYREFWCLCALSAVARELELFPVLREFDKLVVAERKQRGFDTRDHAKLMDAALDRLQELHENPMGWAKDWLKEFDAEPDDGPIAFLKFADHWQRQFEAVKQAIQSTSSRN